MYIILNLNNKVISMKKKYTYLAFACCFALAFIQQTAYAQHFCQQKHHSLAKQMAATQYEGINSRSDTIDILHYDLDIRLTDFANKILEGDCGIQLTPKMNNVSTLRFDLLGLTVTSVSLNDAPMAYDQQSPQLLVYLPQAISVGDTITLHILYSGVPQTAAFGGFYFNSTYAYNLGVGIGIDPPVFGRAWFPCFDNFVERSTYDFRITTLPQHKAYCGGVLQGSVTNPDNTRTWHWQLQQTIPTYLASVAVSDYTEIAYSHAGLEGDIPVILAARSADTADFRQSFVHLPEAIDGFESAYGKYRWDRVGFVAVPFNGGAMEHATNIAYPAFAIDGSLNYETLYAHELSHHWWGDLVTCETAADMWLNEGWASFSEALFLEKTYGVAQYRDYVRQNHREVLQYAHIRDGAYYPVSGVPAAYTYGTTVYNKGADVAHTLRGFMGDTLFFLCVKNYMEEFAFRTANSQQFIAFLSNCSGLDLQPYLEGWVMQAGFPHFAVDSMSVVDDGGSYKATVYIRQRLYAAPNFCQQVPLELTFIDADFQQYTTTVYATGECSAHLIELPFYPTLAMLDLDQKINDATVDNYKFLETNGTYDFTDTNIKITIDNINAPAFVHAIHHWVMPDRFAQPPLENLILSNNRYFTIEGIAQGVFEATAEITYNGANSLNGGYLDNTLISAPEDKLKLLYRPSSAYEWSIYPDFQIQTGASLSDKRGTVRVNNLQFGDYALGIVDPTRTDTLTTHQPENCVVVYPVNTNSPTIAIANLNIRPNPAYRDATLIMPSLVYPTTLEVYNLQGKLYLTQMLLPNTNQHTLSVAHWTKGIYLIRLQHQGKVVGQGKLLVN